MCGKRGRTQKTKISEYAYTKVTNAVTGVEKYQCCLCGNSFSKKASVGPLTDHFRRCRGNPETKFEKLKEIDALETLSWYENFYFCAPGVESTTPRKEMLEVVEHFMPEWERLRKDLPPPVPKEGMKKMQIKPEASQPTEPTQEIDALKLKVQTLEVKVAKQRAAFKKMKRELSATKERAKLTEAFMKQFSAPDGIENRESPHVVPLPDSGLNSSVNSGPSSRETSEERK